MLNTSRSLCACCTHLVHADSLPLQVAGSSRRAFSVSRTVQRAKPVLNKPLPAPVEYDTVLNRNKSFSAEEKRKFGDMFVKILSEQHQLAPGATIKETKEGKLRPPAVTLDELQVRERKSDSWDIPATPKLAQKFKEILEEVRAERYQLPSGATTIEGKSRRPALPLDQLHVREQKFDSRSTSTTRYETTRKFTNNKNDFGKSRDRRDNRLSSSLKDESPPVDRSNFGPFTRRPSSSYGEDRKTGFRSARGRDRRTSIGVYSNSRKRSSEPKLSLRERLQVYLPQWSKESRTRTRFELMGFSAHHTRVLLGAFVAATPKTDDGWFPKNEDKKWQMQRVEWEARIEPSRALDGALTRRFLAWLFDESSAAGAKDTITTTTTKEVTQAESTESRTASSAPQTLVPAEQLEHARKVYDALDYTHPEEWFPVARLAQRTIHMHVGPTNSGKTYAALRALARAEHGVYASPLRMLAYEIYARLNAGKIAPDSVSATEAENAAPGTFARACNLLTGEEARVVDPFAGLLACTIEMFNHRARYDVAVVDEIQMISDPDRGGAWAAAVLGLNAREIHLCGEEGAVPLVQTMLRATGDEVIVHRYERLTPLQPARTALNGRLKEVRKGDCVVAFARTSIFKLKERIERETGLRCAVVYGRLPPEVRAEQAELFNDPESGYDVLVGSDAIGMGLNLRIKRMIFADAHKYDGSELVPLSLSQLKQIAGRAGRYGLHGDDTSTPGLVTSLKKEDLPAITRAVTSKTVPITPHAVLPLTLALHESLEQLIPQQQDSTPTPFATIADLQRAACRLPPHFIPGVSRAESADAAKALDVECKGMTIVERMRAADAPVAWRDDGVRPVALRFMCAYRTKHVVRWSPALEGTGLLEALEVLRAAREGRAPSLPLPLLSSPDAQNQPEQDQQQQQQDNQPEQQQEKEGKEKEQTKGDKKRAKQAASLQGVLTDLPTALAQLETLYRIAVVYMWHGMRTALAYPDREEAVRVKEECQELIEWCLAEARAGRFNIKGRGKGVKEREGKGVKGVRGTRREGDGKEVVGKVDVDVGDAKSTEVNSNPVG